MKEIEQIRQRAEKFKLIRDYAPISEPTKQIRNAMLILAEDIERLLKCVEVLRKRVKQDAETDCPVSCTYCDITQSVAKKALAEADKILEGGE